MIFEYQDILDLKLNSSFVCFYCAFERRVYCKAAISNKARLKNYYMSYNKSNFSILNQFFKTISISSTIIFFISRHINWNIISNLLGSMNNSE